MTAVLTTRNMRMVDKLERCRSIRHSGVPSCGQHDRWNMRSMLTRRWTVSKTWTTAAAVDLPQPGVVTYRWFAAALSSRERWVLLCNVAARDYDHWIAYTKSINKCRRCTINFVFFPYSRACRPVYVTVVEYAWSSTSDFVSLRVRRLLRNLEIWWYSHILMLGCKNWQAGDTWDIICEI